MDRLEKEIMNNNYDIVRRFLSRKSGRKARNLKRLNRYIDRWW